MNADEKRKVFEELLEEYQNHIESEFSYEDGEREAERKAWLNKYDGIKEPLFKDERVRKAVRVWADFNGVEEVTYFKEDFGIRLVYHTISIDLYSCTDELENYKHYTITELCGEGGEE